MLDPIRVMPLWIKMVCIVFVFTAAVLLFISYKLITVSSDHNIQREYAGALDKHVMLRNAMQMYAGTMADKFDYSPALRQDMLMSAVQNYGKYYTDSKSFIAITSRDGQKLYSSLAPEDEQIMGLNPTDDGRRSYVLRTIGSRNVIFVSGWVELGGQPFRLDYEHDISELFKYQKSLAIQISIWICAGMIVLAAGLYVLIKSSLRPLAEVSKQAQAISNGSYTHRIYVRSEDEIGQLAFDFNQMAAAVETNIALLQRTVQEREALIASLAHELKTPLTSIMGYASLLMNYELSQSDAERAAIAIHSESRRLDELAKKLLDLFRLTGEQVMDRKMTAISGMLQQLDSITRYTLTSKGQTLQYESTVEQSYLDQELFLVLMLNLTENASKASEQGAVIRIDVYGQGEFVVFCVADTGCGIPEVHWNDIFQPFFMLDPARDRQKNGYGLGLSLCKAIVEAHDGTIDMESQEGAGTRIYVRIPQAGA